MKTVKSIFLTLCLASASVIAIAQSHEEFDKQETHTGRFELSKSVQLFPNPAVEFLSVKFAEPIAKRTQITLHNIIGSSLDVERETIDDFEVRLRVKDLPSGYYLLALKDEHNQQSGALKFLKR
ncbi:MAG: T9SS type A sorting domain-containing protein [Bacteroidota bacterium]